MIAHFKSLTNTACLLIIYMTVAFLILLKENSEVREHELSSTVHGIQFCLDDSLDLSQFSVYVL